MEINKFYILLRLKLNYRLDYIYGPFKDRFLILAEKLFYLERMAKTVYEAANLFYKRELFFLSLFYYSIM